MMYLFLTLLLSGLPFTSLAQSSCSNPRTPSYAADIASGYRVGLVATGLSRPRSLQFDSEGHLLVVDAPGSGGAPAIIALTLTEDAGACVQEQSRKNVIEGNDLNHGMALSTDGTTLYASSAESVWSWAYSPQDQSASNQRMLVGGMRTSGHATRTLLLSQKVDDTLLVSFGSDGNIDPEAEDISTGVSQIKAFDLGRLSGDDTYTYANDGRVLGWGLRNSVGIAEHPETGGIWSVENSADNLQREDTSISENNPGEELNFHGYLNGTENDNQGSNFGYPQCYAAWGAQDLPQNNGMEVGSSFAADGAGGNDTYCAEQTEPRLTFLAHQAPLDIKFNDSGSEAWISMHGSWNRQEPSGYKVSLVRFANGEPVEPSTSTNAAIDIYANADNSRCSDDDCFRPAGLAFDSQGRLYVSSDATGEIFVIVKDGFEGAANGTNGGSGTPSSGAERPRWKSLAVVIGLVGVATFVFS